MEGEAGRDGEDCLNHRPRKADRGCSSKGGDQTFMGPTKGQLRVNDTAAGRQMTDDTGELPAQQDGANRLPNFSRVSWGTFPGRVPAVLGPSEPVHTFGQPTPSACWRPTTVTHRAARSFAELVGSSPSGRTKARSQRHKEPGKACWGYGRPQTLGQESLQSLGPGEPGSHSPQAGVQNRAFHQVLRSFLNQGPGSHILTKPGVPLRAARVRPSAASGWAPTFHMEGRAQAS